MRGVMVLNSYMSPVVVWKGVKILLQWDNVHGLDDSTVHGDETRIMMEMEIETESLQHEKVFVCG